ncbi:hypothetical protein NST48_09220 [Paenibacillus sp. FSL M7-0547]|uniref:hypothetical protein n=1 Tax=Paenibacillus sp. FSL M7-0547 TaxID=2954755 RepID=UPI0030FA8408
MERSALISEARTTGKNAPYNLHLIRNNPEIMLQGKVGDAEVYLNNMIRIAKLEMKNDRRQGQSQLRTRLKSLVVSILTVDRDERKGVKRYGL